MDTPNGHAKINNTFVDHLLSAKDGRSSRRELSISFKILNPTDFDFDFAVTVIRARVLQQAQKAVTIIVARVLQQQTDLPCFKIRILLKAHNLPNSYQHLQYYGGKTFV